MTAPFFTPRAHSPLCPTTPRSSRAAIRKAHELGADIAGTVPAKRLVDCPSTIAEKRPGSQDRGTYIVLGLSHDPEHPELDLWEPGRGTPGDRILARIGKDLARWLQEEYGVRARLIPYRLEDGGIYLKDAACMGGSGGWDITTSSSSPATGRGSGSWRYGQTWTAPKNHHRREKTPAPAARSTAPAPARWTPSPPERTAGNSAWRERIDHCRACELACPGGDEA